MSLPTPWTLGGTPFARVVSGVYVEWFEPEEQRQVDQVIGNDTPRVDIGGITYPPLQVQAAFLTRTDRDAFQTAVFRHTMTLAKPVAGRSATVRVVKATASSDGALWYCDLTCEWLGS